MESPTALISEDDSRQQSERIAVQDTGGLYLLSRTERKSWLKTTERKIRKLGELKRGWDSYGAYPVDPNSISTALEFIAELAGVTGICEPAVAGTPSGHVALMWSWKDGTRELEMAVLPTGELQYCLSDEHDPAIDREGSTSYPEQIAVMLTMH